MLVKPLFAALFGAGLPLFSWMFPACAQSCSFSVANVTFGTVDTLSGGQVNTTATLSANCTGLSLTRILICPNIGTGSGGANASFRQLSSGAGSLDYQLYSDAARTTIWGSYFWAYSARPPDLALTLGALGTGSQNYTIYAALPAGQSSASAGTYLSAFSGGDSIFYYRYSLLSDCSNQSGTQAQPAFQASAMVAANCLVSTQDVNFGAHGVLTANVDAAGTVFVTCTPGSAFSVGLGPGAAGGGPTAREMRKGSEKVVYGLYQDAARSLPWGDGSVPGEAVSGTGNGASQNLGVYGRVPAQSTPSAGTYSDTVVVTVTY
ncbi:Spore coat protein U [Nitratireductor indicus C115]|uniref:Spore coat protein U n=2 Tax=Nitratireductor indicus TaxID=721133 RepID=K2NP20_9HYPH|nr:spore coat U domain-containing protein [Nitratireductor indicus]EKF41115.1 Spore coat protein U [Nitratireductor indicus C115]SFQ74544.1 Spore coat protein U (SCPU) domain-containing protein [Nitratireductor indicus]